MFVDICIIRVVIMCGEYPAALMVVWVCVIERKETGFVVIYCKGLFEVTSIQVDIV